MTKPMPSKGLLVATTLLLTALAPIAHAGEDWYYFSGVACQAWNPSDTNNKLRYQITEGGNAYGATNNQGSGSSPAQQTVLCPISFSTNQTSEVDQWVKIFKVTTSDWNDDTEFKCRLWGVGPTFATWTSAWRWTCSTVGGCTTATSSWASGGGNLQWTDPLSSNTINIDALHLECLIPRIDNSNYSWVGNGWAKIAAQVP